MLLDIPPRCEEVVHGSESTCRREEAIAVNIPIVALLLSCFSMLSHYFLRAPCFVLRGWLGLLGTLYVCSIVIHG